MNQEQIKQAIQECTREIARQQLLLAKYNALLTQDKVLYTSNTLTGVPYVVVQDSTGTQSIKEVWQVQAITPEIARAIIQDNDKAIDEAHNYHCLMYVDEAHKYGVSVQDAYAAYSLYCAAYPDEARARATRLHVELAK